MSVATGMMDAMDGHSLRAERLRSHRLVAPARSVAEAAAHLLAVQAQEFWAGRWALGARTGGAPTLRSVDARFDDGTLVRAWTQRGTLHIVPSADLGWMLGITAQRQLRAAAPRYRELGLDDAHFLTAERAIRAALRGGKGLTRAGVFAVLESVGIDPAQQRGIHTIQNLALRGIICQGPVVHRAEGIAREQLFVLTEEHIAVSARPSDPEAEMFVRYIIGHGPATAADFAWWSGLPITVTRAAASRADTRIGEIEEGLFAAAVRPRRHPRAASVFALGAFEEYYISYADRSPIAQAAQAARIGPGKNGIVRPILLADGAVIGTWRQSTAVGRHTDAPEAEVFSDADAPLVAAALSRYATFISG